MIIQPTLGDIVNPDGDILVLVDDRPSIVKGGRIRMAYAKGIMAIKYGWHVFKADRDFLYIERK